MGVWSSLFAYKDVTCYLWYFWVYTVISFWGTDKFCYRINLGYQNKYQVFCFLFTDNLRYIFIGFLSTKYHAHGLNHVTMQLDGVQDVFVFPSFYRMTVYSKMIRNNWSARWWCIHNSLSKATILVPIWCSWHRFLFYMTSATTFVWNVWVS